MLRRKFTLSERFYFLIAADRVKSEVDAELGELFLRVASGDDSALALAHERLAVLGDFEGAERLRKLVTEP